MLVYLLHLSDSTVSVALLILALNVVGPHGLLTDADVLVDV